MEVAEVEKKGKTYYTYELLSTTADGDEGGRHVLISASVSGGKLYVIRFQSGDKRWFKGQEREIRPAFASFSLA